MMRTGGRTLKKDFEAAEREDDMGDFKRPQSLERG